MRVDLAAMAPSLTEADARRLTLQLKLLFGSIADQIDRVKELIAQAKSGQADVALGYKSWTAYCKVEFAGALPILERPRRLELVSSLTELGMSSRAIAPIAGVSHMQVTRDQTPAGVTAVTPDAANECDPDALISTTMRASMATTLAAIDAVIVEDNPPVHRPKFIGMDGKTYTAPAPRKQRRSSLPDSYRHAVHDLDKAIRRLERLHADDRFDGNRKAVSDIHWKLFSELSMRLADLDAHLYSGHRPDDPETAS